MSDNPYPIECAEWRRSNPKVWDEQLSLRIKRTIRQHIEQGPEREAIALKMPHVDSVMRGYWGICDMNSPQFKAWQEWMERRAKLRGCNKLVASRAGNWMPA